MAKAGHKSSRGVPEKYDEIKQGVSFSLTPTAKRQLSIMAKNFEPSASEFIENIARKKYLILPYSIWGMIKRQLSGDLVERVEELN